MRSLGLTTTVDPLAAARAALARYAREHAPPLGLPAGAIVEASVTSGDWRDHFEIVVAWERRFTLTLTPGTRRAVIFAREIKTSNLDLVAALARFAGDLARFAAEWEAEARETLGRDS